MNNRDQLLYAQRICSKVKFLMKLRAYADRLDVQIAKPRKAVTAIMYG
jgi:hypothetical protein